MSKNSPKIGSVIYRDMGFVEHSGVYVGEGRVIHLEGNGDFKYVSVKEFMDISEFIYVPHSKGRPLGKKKIAQRAHNAANKNIDYSLVFDNCHQFCSDCLDKGKRDPSVTFLFELKMQVEKKFGRNVKWKEWDGEFSFTEASSFDGFINDPEACASNEMLAHADEVISSVGDLMTFTDEMAIRSSKLIDIKLGVVTLQEYINAPVSLKNKMYDYATADHVNEIEKLHYARALVSGQWYYFIDDFEDIAPNSPAPEEVDIESELVVKPKLAQPISTVLDKILASLELNRSIKKSRKPFSGMSFKELNNSNLSQSKMDKIINNKFEADTVRREADWAKEDAYKVAYALAHAKG